MWYDNEVTQGILQKKYLHEGEKTFDDLVNRVSSIYSEDIRKDIRNALYNADFSPAGRTLYAVGMKGKRKLSVSNCFTEEVKVLTTCGLKSICDVKVGDNVVTETGVYPVEKVFKREYTGDLIKISSKTLLDTIVCTPNHKLLTNNGWVEASSLVEPDGKIQYLKYHSGIDIASYMDYGKVDLLNVELNNATIVETSSGKLQYRKFVANKGGTHCWSTFGNPINRYIDIDNDFMYFIGRWIGNGSITKREGASNYSILQIVFNATAEMDAARRIIDIGTNKFGIMPSTRLVEKQNTFVVRFESPIIGEFFEASFGHGCTEKHLPDKFLGNKYIVYGILDSGGCVTSTSSIQLIMKNKGLVDWVRKSLAVLGVFCTELTPTEHTDTWRLVVSSSFATQKILPFLTKTYNDSRMVAKYKYDLLFDYARVDSVEAVASEKPIFVYNLQIATDHTYNVNNVVVHNCYVEGNVKEDTLESISETDYNIARIGSMGGGIGFAVDNIRPKGSKINNAAVESDGVAFVMRKINQTGQIVGQQGRGLALMCAINCNHPDIYEFLNIKANHEALESMNISIKFTDDFMQAVLDNKDYELYFKVESTGEEIRKTINARDFFEEMCKVSWDTGDPGVIFIDRVRNYNLVSGYPEYVIDVCNP